MVEAKHIGSNQWSTVLSKLEKCCAENERRKRDLDSLGDRFDNLLIPRSSLKNPSCLTHVRRVKEIAKSDFYKVTAACVGKKSSDDLNKNLVDEVTAQNADSDSPLSRKRRTTSPLGAKETKRKVGSGGINRNEEDILISHVGELTATVTFFQKVPDSTTPTKFVGVSEIKKNLSKTKFAVSLERQLKY